MILRENDDLSISTDASSLKLAVWETNLQFFQNKGRIYLSKKSQVPKVVSSRYGSLVYFFVLPIKSDYPLESCHLCYENLMIEDDDDHDHSCGDLDA